MKRLIGVAVFFLLIAALHAAETYSFQEARPKKKGDIEVISEPLANNDKLVVKLPRGFLILTFTNVKSIEKNQVLVESCEIHWLHLEQDQISTGKEKSKIEYEVTSKNFFSQNITQKSGSQEFHKTGVNLSWSYRDDDSVHIYFEPGCLYAIIKGKSPGTPKTDPPHR
jgi:hypothetical protein